MKHIKIWFTLMALLCGIGCFVFFYQAYPYHLQHREQMLLFTYTWQQITSYLNHPAALACLAGDFFTQFLHLKFVGPLVIAAALVKLEVMGFLTFRRWMNDWMAGLLSVLLFAWEGLRLCEIHYPLASTAALIGGFFFFLCIAQLKGRWTFVIGSFLGVFVAYYLAGYGVLIYVACIAVESVYRNKKRNLSAIGINKLSINNTADNEVGIKETNVNELESNEVKECHCAQNSIAVSLGAVFIPLIGALLPAILTDHFLMTPAQAYSYPATTWVSKPNYANERILGLSTAYYKNDWNKVIELAYQDAPSNDCSICYNLANAVQGRLAERLMYYYQPAGLALFMPVYEESTYLTTQLAGEVWFRLGDMTMAEHASMLSMIFSPDNKSSRMVKRMAEINLINGENEAAMKYLNILSKTLFYKDWAEERMPGQESEAVKSWLAEKRKFLPKKDALRLSSTDVVTSLHTLLDSNPDNKMARDYLLCFHLLMKDLDSFISDYQIYYKEKPNRLYAEALMIHLFQKRAKANEVKATGIHPSVIKDFNRYNQLYNQSKGNASAIEGQFARTYWFYFHFAEFE